jgi:hypothetical protein
VGVYVAVVFGWSHCSIVQGPWSKLEMLDQWAFGIYDTHIRWEWWLEGGELEVEVADLGGGGCDCGVAMAEVVD